MWLSPGNHSIVGLRASWMLRYIPSGLRRNVSGHFFIPLVISSGHRDPDREVEVLKLFIHYVSRNVIGMVGLSCYILADTFFVAMAMGADGLAALNFAISLYCLLNGTGLMIGIGGATRYTILKAQHSEEKAAQTFSHAVILGIAVGIVFAVTGMFGADFLASLLGARGEIGDLAGVYLRTIFLFAPFFITNNIMLAFVRNDGGPGLSMAAMLLGSFSNIVLDYIFMFPLGMGMFGAAFATCLAPVISLALLSLHFRGKLRTAFVWRPLEFTVWKESLALGLSSFITEISSGIVLIVFNLVILNISGTDGVAAYGVVANLALVVTAVFTGIAQGAQPLISRGYGDGNSQGIRQVSRYALVLSVATAAVVYCFCFLFGEWIVALFNQQGNPTLAALAVGGLQLYFVGFFLAGINILTASFLSGTNKPVPAFSISIVRGCIGIIPIVLILADWLGMTGVWMAFPAAELVAFCISLWGMRQIFFTERP